MIREFRGIIFPSISRYDLKYLGSSLDTSSRQSQIEKFSKALFKKRALRLKDLASLKTHKLLRRTLNSLCKSGNFHARVGKPLSLFAPYKFA